MYLFFDLETNGLPKDKTNKTPMTEVDNFPRVIELAWRLCDKDGNDLSFYTRLIKPDCWEIPAEPFWADHGFTTEKSKREGIPLRQALTEFIDDLNRADYLIAHNVEFDHPTLGAEMIRYQMKGKRLQKVCTMKTTIDFCAIPFAGQRAWLSKAEKKYKFPKLSELHQKLFGKDFESAHSAGGDLAALKACFFELLRIGIINLEPITTQP